MARPVKFRRVEFFPENNYFIPCRKQKNHLVEVALKVEELEAIRLKDVLNLNQEECAGRMKISRQTFQIILDNARKTIAGALTEGKAIRIEGGSYTTENCQIKCHDCGDIYEINYEIDQTICPSCSSSNIECRRKLDTCEYWCNVKK